VPKRGAAPSGPVPHIPGQPPAIPPPQSGRATAAWAVDAIKGPPPPPSSTAPFIGHVGIVNISGGPDEPAFAGRVRMAPGDEATFETGKVRSLDDDDDVLPARRGSRAGMLVLVMALLVMGAGAAGVYFFVIRPPADDHAAAPVKDAGSATADPVAPAALDAAAAAAIVPPAQAGDAAAEQASPLDAVRGELAADLEPRLRTRAQSLEPASDPASLALRAHLLAQLAEDLQDRASLVPDKPAGDALRKDAKQLVLDAATAAQRALKAAGDDATANLAMAEVLRLQGKPARDVGRYLDTARARPPAGLKRDLALADGLTLVRDGKLDEAKAAFTAIDQGDDKLETSGDVRARLHLALVLAAQDRSAEAKLMNDAVLAAQPEHATAKALAARLETAVAKTDPLPPESGAGDPPHQTAQTPPTPPLAHSAPASSTPPPAASTRESAPRESGGGGGDSYERLIARANSVADTSCAKAMEFYSKALDQKPNGVEALTGMGYCHIDAKQFASAFSKFRAALAVSPRYEPALRGVAEAYQQQGRRDQAIEAYRAYLEIYPDSTAAKKQLERLGGDAAPGGTPPAQPAPDPAAGSGSGSGSG
jgi:tetratricopeptide (TPR) repeat protein